MPRKFFVAFALTCLSFGRQPVFFDASPAEPIFIANPIANDSATSSEPVSDIPINRETKAVLDELAGIVARVDKAANEASDETATYDFEGKVVRIFDGDTIEVLVDEKPVRVRLHRIDAPERGQDYSTKARTAISKKVFQKVVSIRKTDTDRYGRTVGVVYLDEDVNLWLLSQGWAWRYKHYDSNKKYAAAIAHNPLFRLGRPTGLHGPDR